MTENFDPTKNDQFCTKLLEQSDTEDLFEWLEKNDDIERTLGEYYTQAESKNFAEKLDIAGAVNVWVVQIERASKKVRQENSGQLVIKLPIEKSKRLNLLKIENEISEQLGFDGVPDKGQDYLYIHLD